MPKGTLRNIPPIRGLKREPCDTDASVRIGGAEPVVKANAKKKKLSKKLDKRFRVTIANIEQLQALQAKFGITKPALINVALTHLAKEFLS